jgi:Cof subfamily protein (haloacid dehalogenase superfamily)
MGICTGYMLLSDMDGTLLMTDCTISSENRKAIQWFMDEGGLFSVATGRAVKSAWEHIHNLSINCPAILLNGANIFDYQKNVMLHRVAQEKSRVVQIIQDVTQRFPCVGVIVFDTDSVIILQTCSLFHADEWAERDMFVNGTVEDLSENPLKILFLIEKDQVDELWMFISKFPIAQELSIVQSSDVFVEVLSKGATKGKALEWLSEYMGIPQEKTIAIGDYGNDLEMIQYAGIGAAPSNAHAEILAVANMVVSHHEQHAIADLLKRIFGEAQG